MDIQRIHSFENQAVLKEYYAKYLTEVRKVREYSLRYML